jgi:cation:H+ antiporter
LVSLVAVAVGLVLLVLGAELLVRGASRLALSFRISPVVVGLTVVAFGTSTPELAVSIGASFSGASDVSIGNVVGSNIYNVLLILGIGAVITPLLVEQRIVRTDVPLMIGVSLLFWFLASDGNLSLLDGVGLFSLLVLYTVLAIRSGRQEQQPVEQEYAESLHPEQPTNRLVDIGLVGAGLALLVVGAQLLVGGAVEIATSLGVSELVVGLTVVAIGTSLPELMTTAIAAFRGQRDIAVGNVVGSNIFNILAVLGLSSILSPGGIPVSQAALSQDIPVMVAVAIAVLPVAFVGYIINRWEGFLFVAFAVLYTTYLVMDATQHDLADGFRTVMVFFVIPLVALTLGIFVVRELRLKRRQPA